MAEDGRHDMVSRLRDRLLKKTKGQIRERYEESDIHVIRAIGSVEDLESVFNLLSEDAREWYGVHFPELERITQNNQSFLKLVAELGDRQNFAFEKILETLQEQDKATEISEKAKTSMGSQVSEDRMSLIRGLAKTALETSERRALLSAFVEAQMREMAPNFSKIATPLLGAKLLAAAGGMKKLALMSSSTIQVMGAEKALFSHIKTGSPSPKHGLIFNHPLIQQTPRNKRGKIARALAGKLSIAARADYFGKREISAELEKDLDSRAKEIEQLKPKAGQFKPQNQKPRTFEGGRKAFGNSGPGRLGGNRNRFGQRPGGFGRNRNGFGQKRAGFGQKEGFSGTSGGEQTRGFSARPKMFGSGKPPKPHRMKFRTKPGKPFAKKGQ